MDAALCLTRWRRCGKSIAKMVFVWPTCERISSQWHRFVYLLPPLMHKSKGTRIYIRCMFSSATTTTEEKNKVVDYFRKLLQFPFCPLPKDCHKRSEICVGKRVATTIDCHKKWNGNLLCRIISETIKACMHLSCQEFFSDYSHFLHMNVNPFHNTLQDNMPKNTITWMTSPKRDYSI